MFKRLDANPELVSIELDGVEVGVPAGVSVAAALLWLDAIPSRRSPVSGAARAPFCMMGACFDCLVEIDGAIQRGCQLPVRDGMRLRRQLTPGGDA